MTSKRGLDSQEPDTTDHITNYDSKYPPKINMFLSFRQHVACTNRFNLYINNLNAQYEKNIYLRKLNKNEYDIFLTQKFNNVGLLKAIFEYINKSKMQNESSLILNRTSVHEDHLKRILISDQKDYIQTWFANVKRDYNTVHRRILDPKIPLPTLKFKTLKHTPFRIQSGNNSKRPKKSL